MELVLNALMLMNAPTEVTGAASMPHVITQ
jgi:hypothetical protein